MFYKFPLLVPNDMFTELANSINFEPITKGRVGTNIVKPIDNSIPIICTTTPYNKPAQLFKPIHDELV